MSTPGNQSASADVWTVRRILEWTTAFLKQKSVESPRLEAELLLAHARKCQRIRLYTDIDDELTDVQRLQMRESVQRRAKREPLAYIIGTREFYGRSFEVGQGVLIPRPETETLVDISLERIPKDQPRSIAEVGFGSGCIAVTIARQRPLCKITATDLSGRAMEIASRNVQKLEVADRVTLLSGDVLEPLLSSGPVFDGLISNPPYIRDDERESLEPEVVQHEPAEALFAGADGLDIVRRIAADASTILKPGAFIALELDPTQCETVAAMLKSFGFGTTAVRCDLSGNKRIVEGILT
jgi:release factor glutamine methyltransferase